MTPECLNVTGTAGPAIAG